MHLLKAILFLPCLALLLTPAGGRPLESTKERFKATTVSRALLQDTASLVSSAMPMPSPKRECLTSAVKRSFGTRSSVNNLLTGRYVRLGLVLDICGMSLSCKATQHLRQQGRHVRRWAGCQQQLRCQAMHCL